MGRVLRPGLVLLQYVGAVAILFRSKVEERKHITIEPNDYVLVDDVTAIYLTRGTQYKKVGTEVDLSSFILGEDPLEMVDDKAILHEMMERELLDHAPDVSNLTNDELIEVCVSRGLMPAQDDETKMPEGGVESTTASGTDAAEAKAQAEAEAKAQAEAEAKAQAEAEAKAQAEAEAKVGDAVVVTLENIMDEEAVSLQDIKEACKKHKITIGRKKRADLVALLIPYLEQEA